MVLHKDGVQIWISKKDLNPKTYTEKEYVTDK